MTLDLKAKANQVFDDYFCSPNQSPRDLKAKIADIIKEVQDATRRETIEECAEKFKHKNHYRLRPSAIMSELLALLTTPEKKEG